MSFSGVVTALLATDMGVPVGWSILIGLADGFFLSVFLNGLIVTKTKMPPLIATLAMLQVIQGIGFIISNGLPVYDIPSSFKWIAQGRIGIIPVPIIIMVIILIIGHFILEKNLYRKILLCRGQ